MTNTYFSFASQQGRADYGSTLYPKHKVSHLLSVSVRVQRVSLPAVLQHLHFIGPNSVQVL